MTKSIDVRQAMSAPPNHNFEARGLPSDAWSDEERRQRDRQLSFLFDRINYERLPAGSYVTSDFKLQRMEALLARLGHPERDIPAIHIAGTKGKGTTAHLAAALLQSAGLKVGLFTSPHIHRFEERMTVDGEFASVRDLEAIVDQLRPVLLDCDGDRVHSPPTFFEVCTAMAWLHFRRHAVDAVVLEVGLGGRLDATNVCRPEVSVITSISRDHTQLLGSELSSIAREKAGIIKSGVPVISGVSAPDAREVIRGVALESGCELRELDREICIVEKSRLPMSALNPLARERATIVSPGGRNEGVAMPAPGAHHLRNAAMAISAAELFLQRRPELAKQPPNPAALSKVQLPLRGEVLGYRPLRVVDGAHNEASLQSVVDLLAPFPRERRRLVFGVSRDKDARAMLRLIDGQFSQVILTAYETNPRALPLAELAQLAEIELAGSDWTTAIDPAAALLQAEQDADADEVICVTGSIFLGAEVRELILRRGVTEPAITSH